MKLTSPTPGVLSGAKGTDPTGEPLICNFKSNVTRGDDLDGKPSSCVGQTAEEMVRFAFRRLVKGNKNLKKKVNILVRPMSEMIYFGLFKNQPMVLCHGDLEGRNIMVEMDDEDSSRITGILDWDLATFAPKFMACRPVSWMWNSYHNTEHPEHVCDICNYTDCNAAKVPVDPEAQEIKAIFDHTVGKEFAYLACSEHYRLARKLVRNLLSGWKSTEAIDTVEELLKEWEPKAKELFDKLER